MCQNKLLSLEQGFCDSTISDVCNGFKILICIGYVLRIWVSNNMVEEWNLYIQKLNRAGIRLNDKKDELVWSFNLDSDSISAKLAYKAIVQEQGISSQKWCSAIMWKWHIPQKVKCFLWILLEDYILTWSNLSRRGIDWT